MTKSPNPPDVGRHWMITLRNGLVTYGACVAGIHLVNLVRSFAIDPFVPQHSQDFRTISVWVLNSCIGSALAGLGAGAAVQAHKAGRWAALLALFVWLEIGGSLDWRLFPDRPFIAFSSLGLAVASALIAVLCFFAARDRWPNRPELAGVA